VSHVSNLLSPTRPSLLRDSELRLMRHVRQQCEMLRDHDCHEAHFSVLTNVHDSKLNYDVTSDVLE